MRAFAHRVLEKRKDGIEVSKIQSRTAVRKSVSRRIKRTENVNL